jgi:predicted phage terminase large subunit-like protein
VEIAVEQEPGSGGKDSAEATVRNLSGYRVKADKVTGNKETRAEPYADQIEAGNILVLKADWTKEFIREHEIAPRGKFMDQWDAAAGAFNKLNVKQKLAGVWGRR